uniref:Uncharacterized protein n=1 Tax=Zea mays TaxID=4577 RepID=C0P4M7_MAIZE|nr:unknown [Zea mays]
MYFYCLHNDTDLSISLQNKGTKSHGTGRSTVQTANIELSCLVLWQEHIANQVIEIPVRRASGLGHLDGLVPPFQCPSPHLLPLLPLHELSDEARHGVAPDVAVDLHPDAPLVALVAAVGLLVGEEGPADDRDAAAHGLQRGVPSAVREERGHGRVVQHRLLRAPGGHEPAAGRLGQELRRQHGGVAPDEVAPDDPQERPAAVGQPPRELHQLLAGHHGDAAEVDVDDGAGVPAVEPPQALLLLLPQAEADGGARGGRVLARQQRERAQRVHLARQAERAHGRHRLALQLVEGVEDHGRRARRAPRLLEDVAHHVLVRVRGADEAREVPEPHVPQPRHVLHRRVKESVRQLLHTFERSEATALEEVVVAVAEEADGAGSPELDVGKAELLGGVDGEAHDDVGDDAGDGRVAEVREQAAEGPEAGLRGGLAQRGDVLRDVVVLRRRQAVGDGGEAEAREAGHGRRPAGPDEARLVVLGVDEGDVEAPGVQQLRHVEHRGDVALRWVRQAHGVRLLRLLLRGAAERTHGGDRRSACAVCVACRLWVLLPAALHGEQLCVRFSWSSL